METSEFDLIKHYFAHGGPLRDDVILGIGDDAALLAVPPGMSVVVSVDTLVAGVHFPEETPPEAIGHKALAVNLSDMAAMGAEPSWATLALTLPDADDAWLKAFSHGFFSLAEGHGVQLVGGDTTRGPLSITVQVMGFVPAGTALRRSGARPGDAIFVTGTLGDAGAGLGIRQGKLSLPVAISQQLIDRLERPIPRITAGLALRGLATAAIDISDGLGADLGHILEASQCGAEVNVDQIPLSPGLQVLERKQALTLATTAGDDYELCFTVPEAHVEELMARCADLPCACTRIGRIAQVPGLTFLDAAGQQVALPKAGFDHFAAQKESRHG